MKKMLMIAVSLIGLMDTACIRDIHKYDTNQLLELEHQWLEHEFISDTVFISSLLDESFLCISPDMTFTKKDILKHITANHRYRQENNIIIDSVRIEDPVIHFYDNTAVVIFTDHTFAHRLQEHLDTKTPFYDVWIRSGGLWKAVSSQAHY